MATPKLRFKEFDGDWENYELGNISDIKTGPFGSTLHQEDYVESGTPIITVEHLGEIGITSQNLPLVSDQDKIRLKAYALQEGDIAFSRVGSVDRCAIITDKESGWLFSGRILRVRPNQKNINSKNLMYALKTEDAKHRIRSVAVGQTMPSLNTEILKNFSISLSSSKEEQTKIASFLSAVDEKISQLTQKHELLSQWKQGMMQKLFSQQLRFKADDGSEFGEWEETTLGEIGTFKSGQGFPEQFQGGKDGIPFFKVSDMNILGNEKIMKVANNYVNSEAITKMKAKVIDNEAIIFAKVGAAIFLERKRLAKNFLIDNNMMAYLSNQKMNIMFLKQFLDNIKLSKFVQVGALPSYNSSDLAIIPISLPCLEEQTKIANFLSAIDQKIEVVAQQIEQAKTWKKGLLQQMFV